LGRVAGKNGDRSCCTTHFVPQVGNKEGRPMTKPHTLLALLAGALIVSAAACGDDSPAGPTTPTTPTTPANRAPRVERMVDDLELTRGTQRTLDLDGHFVDPDGDVLTLTATSSNTHVAPVELSGTMLDITAENLGQANVRVEATDPAGLSATLSFSVTVERPAGAITNHAGNCVLDMLLGPGGSCDVPGGERFEVLEDGRGRYGFITAGTGITINQFSARRVSGTDNWRIESLP